MKAEPGNCSGIRPQNAFGRFRLNLQKVIGLSTDRLPNPVAMLRPPLKRSKNEYVKSALEQFQALIVCVGAP